MFLCFGVQPAFRPSCPVQEGSMAAVCVAGTCDANVFKPHSQGATFRPWRRVDQATGSLGAVCSRSQRVSNFNLFQSQHEHQRKNSRAQLWQPRAECKRGQISRSWRDDWNCIDIEESNNVGAFRSDALNQRRQSHVKTCAADTDEGRPCFSRQAKERFRQHGTSPRFQQILG